jgi:Zn-dependent protease/predicted transcriptional regulator
MKWSWKIAEFAGIGVYVHATFLLVVLWVAALHWEEDLAAIVEGVLFVLAIFGCVVLHEFGHALTAKHYGIRTRDITLLPIGGVARLERMPDDPKQELIVAVAGPAVNVVIAALLYVVVIFIQGVDLAGRLERFGPFYLGTGSFASNLMGVNIFLVVFNMIPAFPMDGGRVLRGLLATRMEYVRATNIAATVGQFLAFVFGFVGLTGLFGLFTPNPFLVFIALFVYIGAAQEAGMVQMKAALGGIPVERAMLRHFHALSSRDPLQRAVDLTLAGSQRDFPVVEEGQVVGLLCQEDLMRALQQSPSNESVAGAMRTQYQQCEPGDMLESVFARIQEDGAHTVPVVRRGELVGLLTMENIGEMLRIQAAIDKQRGDNRLTQVDV